MSSRTTTGVFQIRRGHRRTLFVARFGDSTSGCRRSCVLKVSGCTKDSLTQGLGRGIISKCVGLGRACFRLVGEMHRPDQPGGASGLCFCNETPSGFLMGCGLNIPWRR
jgi:hypothetical protein